MRRRYLIVAGLWWLLVACGGESCEPNIPTEVAGIELEAGEAEDTNEAVNGEAEDTDEANSDGDTTDPTGGGPDIAEPDSNDDEAQQGESNQGGDEPDTGDSEVDEPTEPGTDEVQGEDDTRPSLSEIAEQLDLAAEASSPTPSGARPDAPQTPQQLRGPCEGSPLLFEDGLLDADLQRNLHIHCLEGISSFELFDPGDEQVAKGLNPDANVLVKLPAQTRIGDYRLVTTTAETTQQQLFPVMALQPQVTATLWGNEARLVISGYTPGELVRLTISQQIIYSGGAGFEDVGHIDLRVTGDVHVQSVRVGDRVLCLQNPLDKSLESTPICFGPEPHRLAVECRFIHTASFSENVRLYLSVEPRVLNTAVQLTRIRNFDEAVAVSGNGYRLDRAGTYSPIAEWTTSTGLGGEAPCDALAVGDQDEQPTRELLVQAAHCESRVEAGPWHRQSDGRVLEATTGDDVEFRIANLPVDAVDITVDHDDGYSEPFNSSGIENAQYAWPGYFVPSVAWSAGPGGDRVAVGCPAVIVAGDPLGKERCATPSGTYRVISSIDDGATVRQGPDVEYNNVEIPRVDLIDPGTSGLTFDSCWQPVGGGTPWWGIRGGYASSRLFEPE